MGILELVFFFLTDTASVQHHVRGSQPSSPWPGGSALSYANTDLTSAVRSKQGRGTLEPSLPPPRLTHSDLFLCPAHTLSLTHTPAPSHTPCVPVRSSDAAPCWILLTRLVDNDSGLSATEGFPCDPNISFDFFPPQLLFAQLSAITKVGETSFSGGEEKKLGADIR